MGWLGAEEYALTLVYLIAGGCIGDPLGNHSACKSFKMSSSNIAVGGLERVGDMPPKYVGDIEGFSDLVFSCSYLTGDALMLCLPFVFGVPTYADST